MIHLYLSGRWKCWQEESRQKHVDEVQQSCVYRVYGRKVENFQSIENGKSKNEIGN